jgi:shikimate dehydrogenase
MHNAAFAALGLDLAYLAFDVESARIGEAVAGLRALRAVGANVTVPHKQAVLPFLDGLDPTAERVRAVNTVVNEDGRLWGHNTDVGGFADALAGAWAGRPERIACLLLGAGGAGRAVLAALLDQGATEVHLFNRTPERARALCAEAAAWGHGGRCRAVLPEEVPGLGLQVNLVVNATSAGLGAVKQNPLPADILSDRHLVIDLVYGAEPTPLLRQARQRGAVAFDGREMLVRQAARAFELWTGRPAPVEVLRQQADVGERG